MSPPQNELIQKLQSKVGELSNDVILHQVVITELESVIDGLVAKYHELEDAYELQYAKLDFYLCENESRQKEIRRLHRKIENLKGTIELQNHKLKYYSQKYEPVVPRSLTISIPKQHLRNLVYSDSDSSLSSISESESESDSDFECDNCSSCSCCSSAKTV
jgi:hypothetical protein